MRSCQFTPGNIEAETQLIALIVRDPTQINTTAATSTFTTVGSVMDSSIDANDNGVMNDNTANAVVASINYLAQSLTSSELETSSNTNSTNSTNRTGITAQLTNTMTNILMVDKLQGSLPGEQGYQYDDGNGVSINAMRIDARAESQSSTIENGSLISCASDYLEFDQIGTIMNASTSNVDTFDCLFSESPSDLWDNIDGVKIYSNVLSLDFTEATDNRSQEFRREALINSVLNHTHNLTAQLEALNIPNRILNAFNVSGLDICDVFVFYMRHTPEANFTDWQNIDTEDENALPSEVETDDNDPETEVVIANFSITLPTCRFFDTIRGNWSSKGCWAVKSNVSVTKCACIHLSSFTISGSDFVPNINVIDDSAIRAFTLKNLHDHPNAVIITTCVVFLFWGLILCLPRENDKPIIAQLRPWSQLQQRKWHKFMLYKQNRVLLSEQHVCWKLFEWFWIYLRNTHSILAVCMRDYGTNWSGPQRLFCFLASVLTLAAVNCLYYGRTSYSDDFASMINACYASMSGTIVPVFLSYLFGFHTPAMVTRQPDPSYGEIMHQMIKKKYQTHKHSRDPSKKDKNSNSNNNANKKQVELIDIDNEQIELDVLGLLAHNDLKAIEKVSATKKTHTLKLKRIVTRTEELFDEGHLMHHFHGKSKLKRKSSTKRKRANSTTGAASRDRHVSQLAMAKSETVKDLINQKLNNQKMFSKRVTLRRTKSEAAGMLGTHLNLLDGLSDDDLDEKNDEKVNKAKRTTIAMTVSGESIASTSTTPVTAGTRLQHSNNSNGFPDTTTDVADGEVLALSHNDHASLQSQQSSNLPLGITRVQTKREATEFHYQALKTTVDMANRMLIPLRVEYPKKDENGNEIVKKKVYLRARELTPEENATLTLIQSHIISYVYWWPHALSRIGWCVGLIWCLACIVVILIFGVNFDLLNSMDASDHIAAAIESNATCATTFQAYDIVLENHVDYQYSTEYALVQSGDPLELAPEWGDVPDTVTWFASFALSFVVSLVFFTPLTSYLIAAIMYCVYQKMWTPKPKHIFYKMKYENKKELKDNIENKFKSEDDLWDGIAQEVDEVAIAEHGYWVLNHPYVREIRRMHFLTHFEEEIDEDEDEDDSDDEKEEKDDDNADAVGSTVNENANATAPAPVDRLVSNSAAFESDALSSENNSNENFNSDAETSVDSAASVSIKLDEAIGANASMAATTLSAVSQETNLDETDEQTAEPKHETHITRESLAQKGYNFSNTGKLTIELSPLPVAQNAIELSHEASLIAIFNDNVGSTNDPSVGANQLKMGLVQPSDREESMNAIYTNVMSDAGDVSDNEHENDNDKKKSHGNTLQVIAEKGKNHKLQDSLSMLVAHLADDIDDEHHV